MKLLKIVTALTILVVISGCATRKVATFDPLPFDEAEYAALPTKGTGIVRGQVFAKTLGGDVKKGAGENVVLIPATQYGNQRYNQQIIQGKFLSRAEDPRYAKYVRAKLTDGEGRFEFSEIPPGTYYVLSSVTWVAIERTSFGPIESTQGGKVVRKIAVNDGVVTDAILNR